MKELLKDHLPSDMSQHDLYFVRSTYELMLCGAIDNPFCGKLEAKPEQLEPYGDWISCDTLPTDAGSCLLFGDYENSDGQFPNAILPAYYDSQYKIWDCTDGWFNPPVKWMAVPWLPEVWEAAKIHYKESTEKYAAKCADGANGVKRRTV